MKKGSGFEKFFKGREKTGAAKKEEFRQEKKQVKREREESIAIYKREKRAQFKAASSNQPPKYNLDPPGNKFKKRGDGEGTTPQPYRPDKTNRIDKKKIELSPKRTNHRTTKPEKGDGPRPFKDNQKSYKTGGSKPYKTGFQKPYSNERPNEFKTNSQKPFRNEDRKPGKADGQKPYKSDASKPYKVNGLKPYKKESARPYIPDEHKPVQQKKEFPNKVEHQDQSVDTLRQEPSPAKPSINRPHTEDELMPLNKYIAHSGVCSRRDAVGLIKGGKVKVNGELILEPGHKVAITDDVRVAGKRMDPVKDFVYILLNKPKDYITTTDDPQERKTVIDLLKGAPQIRIYPVGRLDRNTSGVLLLTNDGDLSQKLTHPSNEIKKVYAVTLDKPLTKVHFEAILKGVPLEDGMANIDSLAFADAQDLTQIGIELHSGRNRIVRRIFEHFGYDIKALDRVIFAGLTKKNVPRGKWRYLNEKEVRDLKFFRKGRK